MDPALEEILNRPEPGSAPAETAAPEPPAPAAEAPAPAEADVLDDLAGIPEDTKFDAAYVKKLRQEAAAYRTRAKQYEVFESYDEQDREVFKQIAALYQQDPSKAAEYMEALAQGIKGAVAPPPPPDPGRVGPAPGGAGPAGGRGRRDRPHRGGGHQPRLPGGQQAVQVPDPDGAGRDRRGPQGRTRCPPLRATGVDRPVRRAEGPGAGRLAGRPARRRRHHAVAGAGDAEVVGGHEACRLRDARTELTAAAPQYRRAPGVRPGHVLSWPLEAPPAGPVYPLAALLARCAGDGPLAVPPFPEPFPTPKEGDPPWLLTSRTPTRRSRSSTSAPSVRNSTTPSSCCPSSRRTAPTSRAAGPSCRCTFSVTPALAPGPRAARCPPPATRPTPRRTSRSSTTTPASP